MSIAPQTVRLNSSRPIGRCNRAQPHALITQKLGALFEVPSDTSAAIDALLRKLDCKACG